MKILLSKIKDIYSPGEGRHWFDKSTLEFFKSQLPTYGYSGPGGIFFVSSEVEGPNTRKRAYTVRELVGPGDIDTVGKFLQWASEDYATEEAKRLAAQARIIKADGTVTPADPQNGKYFSLEECQKVVGGGTKEGKGWVELVHTSQGDLLLINEEGKIHGLPINEKATALYQNGNVDPICGDVLICGKRQFR